MALKDTYSKMKDLLEHITTNLGKAENGNKAAAQRVRTGTVSLEKLAKLYRKESISFEKSDKGAKAKKAKAKPAAAKKAAPVKGKAHAAPAKAKAVKSAIKPRQFAVKKATAKLPQKGYRAR